MNERSHDLFLLMIYLSQVKNKETVLRFFLDAMNQVDKSIQVHIADPDEIVNHHAIEISTTHFFFGNLIVESSEKKLDQWQQSYFYNATQMLALILENREQQTLLSNEKLRLEHAVKERTAALRASEVRFRKIFENAALGIAIIDLKGNFQLCNPAYCSLLGYTMEELLHLTIMSLIHPDDREANQIQICRLLAGELSFFEIENRYLHKNGHPVWVLKYVSILTDETGNAAHLLTLVTDVTRRKKDEEVLRDQRWRLESTIEGTHVGTWEWNIQTGETVFNAIWAEIIGYSLDELSPVGISTWEKYTHPEDLHQSRTILQQHFNGELPYYDCECRMRHKDGHWVWVLDRGKVMSHTPDGKPLMMFGTHSDITARKLSEEQLHQSEERYRLTQRLAGIGIWEFFVTTDKVFWSDEMESISGFAPGEFHGTFQEVTRCVHPDDLEKWQESVRACVENGKEHKIDFRIVWPDGTVHWVAVLGNAVRDRNGHAIKLGGVIMDITERKKVQEELSTEKERLAVTLRSIGDGVIATDNDGNILLINRAGEALTGWTQEEAYGKQFATVFNIIEEITRKKIKLSVLDNKLTGNLKLISRDGRETDIADSCEPIIDSRGNSLGIVFVFRDISERKKYEINLQSSLSQKEILLQELYHRTKNNMQVISALLELQAQSVGSEEFDRIVRDSQTRIRTMALAHEKLYKSKNLSRIDMKGYIEDLTKLISSSYSTSQGIRTFIDVDNVNVLIDIAIPCGLIITELLSNSFKHAFPVVRDGRIDIGLHRKKDNQIEVTIADNGIGIPQEFDISKSPSLGIQLVYQMVKHQLHGSVTLESGGGLRWNICFKDDIYSERVK